mgnify:CR=1 FL=1
MEISIIDILSYKKVKYNKCYTYGGVYMIYDTVNNKYYIGKSIDYMHRLKDHYYNSLRNSGLLIDKTMHNRIDEFRFYLLSAYTELKINFFNRKQEIVLEQSFINTYQSFFPKGYNILHYGHLPTK